MSCRCPAPWPPSVGTVRFTCLICGGLPAPRATHIVAEGIYS